MLEHLHRYDSIKTVLGCELVHVTGDDRDVVEIPLFRLGFDVLTLGVRVRDCGDIRARIVLRHPECQGTPAASEFEDRLTIHELSSLACGPESLILCGVQIGTAAGPVAAAVLASMPERVPEE
jgi:hypothetical protein